MKRFIRITLIAIVASLLLVALASAAKVGAVCPAGDVKYEAGSGYEYTDGSATITLSPDNMTATISVAAGYTLDGWCVKIGGPGGGSTISPSGTSYTSTTYAISHVVVSTSSTTPICNPDTKVITSATKWLPDLTDPSKMVRTVYFEWKDSSTDEVCSTGSELQYKDRPLCLWPPPTYADEPGCEPPPDLIPYCTTEGETKWVPDGTVLDQLPDYAYSGECEPPKRRGKTIKTCPNNCGGGACLWENVNGDGVECTDPNTLYGTQPDGVMVATVISDCTITEDNKCIMERWLIGVSDPDSITFSFLDGYVFEPTEITDAFGKKWLFYANLVGPTENRKTQNSWNSWQVVSEPQQDPYYYITCCLAGQDPFTRLHDDGTQYVLNMPGVCDEGWFWYFVKKGEYTSKAESWVEFSEWLAGLREVPVFGEYPFPNQ